MCLIVEFLLLRQCNNFMQAVSYVDPAAVMMESGTKDPTALPSALYGCPYPSTQNGDCKPPVSCNCYQVQHAMQTAEATAASPPNILRDCCTMSAQPCCLTHCSLPCARHEGVLMNIARMAVQKEILLTFLRTPRCVPEICGVLQGACYGTC